MDLWLVPREGPNELLLDAPPPLGHHRLPVLLFLSGNERHLPMATKVYLAVDLGASGGRVLAGLFDGDKLHLEEVHRFENGGVAVGERLQWDVLRLWTEIQTGLRAAAAKYEKRIVSVAVDTWGVDFGLLGPGDELLGNPYCYRDKRTVGMMDQAFSIVSREEIFAETGLQFMEFNTLYQLLAMKLQKSPLLDCAESFLMIPDLINWLLTGEKGNEITNASTTQFLNPHTRQWSTGMLDKFGIPTKILGKLVEPGSTIGKIRASLADATGVAGLKVVLPGTHDTASAVLAVPAASVPNQRPNWAYISSGTWSLMGVETPTPVTTDRCRQLNFTNEGGIGGTVRLLKNIAGMWLVQECRRIWRQGGTEFGWDDLIRRAQAEPALAAVINPDHASLAAPTNMPAAIRALCEQSNQPVPENEGQVIRVALESIALRYRTVLGMLEELIGGGLDTIHIVGGGTNNKLLCQMAADACQRRVIAGPVEATAIGNVMMQAVADHAVGSIAEAREVIRNSFDVIEYVPQPAAKWDEAYGKFQKLTT